MNAGSSMNRKNKVGTTRRALSLGFIGGGINSAVGQVHFGAAELDGYWRVEAGAFSHRPDISAHTAEHWGIDESRSYSDWREFVQKEADNLDAIAVLTPTPLHAEMVVALLDAGIPVICEKSLAFSVGESERIRQAVNRNSGYLAVTYNYTGYPLLRELKQRIEDGQLGEIQQIHLEMPQEGFVRPPDIGGKSAPPQAWRLQDGDFPTICLDLGTHLHHLALFLTGARPEEVMADAGNYSQYRSISDYVALLVRYSDGVRGTMMFTKTAIGSRNGMRVRIYGTLGSADWLQVDPDEMNLCFIDGSRLFIDRGSPGGLLREARYNRMKAGHPAGFIEAFANLYTDIAEDLKAWRGGQGQVNKYVPRVDEAHEGLLLFEAAQRSLRNGSWQKLPAKIDFKE